MRHLHAKRNRHHESTKVEVPDTMTYNAAEKALARDKQAEEEKARKRSKRKKLGLAIGAAAVVPPLVAVGLFVKSVSGVKESTEPLREPAVSAPAVPGASEQVETPSDFRTPSTYADEMSYEEAKKPMVLNSEQLAGWNSGDAAAQNEIASDVFAQRFETAIFDVEEARTHGAEADISYLSGDTGVRNAINNIVDKFAENPQEAGSYYVCRTNIDYPTDDRCNPLNSEGSKPANFAPDAPMRIIVLRSTMDDQTGANPENGYAFVYDSDMSLAVSGDTLNLVAQ